MAEDVIFTAKDRALLTRLFGPRIPADDSFFSATEAAKSVAWSGANARPALDNLLANIVHQGIGGGFVIGWALEISDGKTILSVRRMKPLAVAA